MPRHFVPKKLLAERMRAEIDAMRSQAVVTGCRCEHRLPKPTPPGMRPVGWVFCGRCRHHAVYEEGAARYCVSEPRLSLPWFKPYLVVNYEPA